MTIYGNSRYYDGRTYSDWSRNVYVRRGYVPVYRNVTYYVWKEYDRIDRIAANYFNDPTMWWKIMDANPQILSPQSIRPGQHIRIPVQ